MSVAGRGVFPGELRNPTKISVIAFSSLPLFHYEIVHSGKKVLINRIPKCINRLSCLEWTVPKMFMSTVNSANLRNFPSSSLLGVCWNSMETSNNHHMALIISIRLRFTFFTLLQMMKMADKQILIK